MKVNPYFKTTLAEPFQGKKYHEKGAEVVMSAEVNTKTLGKFIMIIPDPASLNLNNAQNFIDKCEKLKERINNAKEFTVFSKALKEEEISGLDVDQIKKRDPEANILRNLDDQKIYEYMQSAMGVVVSLVTAVESFLNRVIPYDYTAKRKNRKGIEEIFTKDQIVRRFSIKDKIQLVAKIKGRDDVTKQAFWTTFEKVKELRDDIIHFKKTDANITQIWNPILVSFFDSDLQSFFNATVEMINHLEPKYF